MGKVQYTLFGTVADMEDRLRNLLRRLPAGEHGVGSITGHLYQSCEPSQQEAFATAFRTVAAEGLITPKLFHTAGWTVPGFINRVGRWVEPPRKKRKSR